MWLESPYNGEMINFAEVYKIRCYKHVSSKTKTLNIEVYFFSKDIAMEGDYRRIQDRLETFFDGDLDTGLQVREWLEMKLGVEKFHAIDTPPVEVVVEESSMKYFVDKCMDRVRKIESLLPEDVHLNPFLNSILQDQEAVDYIIERKNNRWYTDMHKSWELDFDKTVEIVRNLGILGKSVELLGFAEKLTQSQKDALKSIIGEGDKTDE